jgi:hypothetical protein
LPGTRHSLPYQLRGLHGGLRSADSKNSDQSIETSKSNERKFRESCTQSDSYVGTADNPTIFPMTKNYKFSCLAGLAGKYRGTSYDVRCESRGPKIAP